MEEIVSILRMVERLLVVGFAGLSIYLGYRLFFQLPSEQQNEGKFELPGIKIVLTKVGPGIFFSVFGSIILLQSLHEKIELSKNGADDSVVHNQTARQHFVGATEPVVMVKNNITGITSKRAAIIEQLGELNCSLKILETLEPDKVTESMKIAFHDAKISLIRQVWNHASWGSIAQLESSVEMGKINSIFYDTSVACTYE